MADMLVKLYETKPCEELIAKLTQEEILIKRAMSPDISAIAEFVEHTFSKGWADETRKAILNNPSSCYIATKEGKVIGFACYDTTALGFFGPTGVDPDYRGKYIGKALLIKCLLSMYEKGYGYAVIGSAGPVSFYQQHCGAVTIPDSDPGIYSQLAGR